jgi:hypothetical protein
MPVGVTVRPDPAPVYRRPVDRMPEPGDRHPGFIAEPMRCWAMVYVPVYSLSECSVGTRSRSR